MLISVKAARQRTSASTAAPTSEHFGAERAKNQPFRAMGADETKSPLDLNSRNFVTEAHGKDNATQLRSPTRAAPEATAQGRGGRRKIRRTIRTASSSLLVGKKREALSMTLESAFFFRTHFRETTIDTAINALATQTPDEDRYR
ncbi:MAG: hypothetical protein AAGM38_07125 [Pseudomonadota bacterium]